MTTLAADDQPDYYFEGEYMVFTAAYHRKRGYCCNSQCRHCPFTEDGAPTNDAEIEEPLQG